MARVITTTAGIGLAASIAWVSLIGPSAPATITEAPHATGSIAQASTVASPVIPSEDPAIVPHQDTEPRSGIEKGTTADRATVEQAMQRLTKAGLDLPPITVVIHDSKAGCDGNNGMFRSDGTDYRIDVCHVSDFVITHELSHVWEHHNATAEARDAFVAAAGLESWNDADTKWVDRGIERAANTMAKVLLSDGGACTELASLYEVLTGTTCPGADA